MFYKKTLTIFVCLVSRNKCCGFTGAILTSLPVLWCIKHCTVATIVFTSIYLIKYLPLLGVFNCDVIAYRAASIQWLNASIGLFIVLPSLSFNHV